MKEFWDSKYASDEYVYGKNPNKYLKHAISQNLLSGKIMFPAEGEGRNAVYAAQQGLNVVAFDQSTEGRIKSMRLAAERGVDIDYIVGEFMKVPIDKEQLFDAAVLVYAHFPEHLRTAYHRCVAKHIKPGGIIVLEAFSKNHVNNQKQNPAVGGPGNISMLYTKDIIATDFHEFEPIELHEVEINLAEGIGHNGLASVVRFIGKKR